MYHYKGQRMSRVGRAAAIRMHMAQSRYDVHTVNSIAKAMEITPSTYLRGVLADMCSRGEILCSTETDDYGIVTRRLYALPERAPMQHALYSEVR